MKFTYALLHKNKGNLAVNFKVVRNDNWTKKFKIVGYKTNHTIYPLLLNKSLKIIYIHKILIHYISTKVKLILFIIKRFNQAIKMYKTVVIKMS